MGKILGRAGDVCKYEDLIKENHVEEKEVEEEKNAQR
jgi:hypothetical protein